jgi:hypothetical protein
VQELVLLHQRGNGVNPGSYQLSPGAWSRYQPISEFTNLDQNKPKNIHKMFKNQKPIQLLLNYSKELLPYPTSIRNRWFTF